MKRSRFSEEQIIGILKERQARLGAKELCRKHRISDATFYKWQSRYGGIDVSDAGRLTTLESENAKLKKMPAERMMDVATLKEMLGKTSEDVAFVRHWSERQWRRVTISAAPVRWPGSIHACIGADRSVRQTLRCVLG